MGHRKNYFAAGYILVVVGVFLALFLLFIANTLSFFVDSRYNNVESKLTKRTKCVYTDKRLSDSIDTFVS